MRFPSIKAVRRELCLINANVEGECDVRLHVWPDGEWTIHYGDPSYDQDHRGYWGAGSVPGVGGKRMRPRRFNAEEEAKLLLTQVKDHHYEATAYGE